MGPHVRNTLNKYYIFHLGAYLWHRTIKTCREGYSSPSVVVFSQEIKRMNMAKWKHAFKSSSEHTVIYYFLCFSIHLKHSNLNDDIINVKHQKDQISTLG